MKKIQKAKKLFYDFSGHELGNDAFEVSMPRPSILIPVGQLDGVLYTTIRDGKKESYIHEFKKPNSQPLLATDADGEQLYILEGNYKFTEKGIVDQ